MRILSLLFLIIAFQSIAKPIPKPHLQDSVATSISSIKYQLKIYKRYNDSLAVELSHYSQREAKYLALFDRYGSRSDTILAIIAAIAAITPIASIATYYKTRAQLNSVRQLSNETIKTLDRAKKALSKIHHNLAASIFQSYNERSNFDHRLNLLYSCLRHVIESSEFGGVDDQRGQILMRMILLKLEKALDEISDKLQTGEGNLPFEPIEELEDVEDIHATIMAIAKDDARVLSATCYAKLLALLEKVKKQDNPEAV